MHWATTPPSDDVRNDRVHRGDAVRVVIPAGRVCAECPHFGGEDGRTGRIVRGAPLPYASTHPHLVMFDRPCCVETAYSGHQPIAARYYAPDELERLR
jgi:hypothetical protein